MVLKMTPHTSLYICDACGKEASADFKKHRKPAYMAPSGWRMVEDYPGRTRYNLNACSQACFEKLSSEGMQKEAEMPIQEVKKVVFTCDACGKEAVGDFRGNSHLGLRFPIGWNPVKRYPDGKGPRDFEVACSTACHEKLTGSTPEKPEYFMIRTKGQGEHKASECPALAECEQTITCCKCGKQSCRGCAPIPENFIFCQECFSKEHK